MHATIQRSLLPLLTALFVVAGCDRVNGVHSIDDERLVHADRDSANWLSYGRTYDEQRFSPLNQIDERSVTRQPDFAIGQRTLLFTADYLSNSRHATYDVHPNGKQFIFITGESNDVAELILVQNLVASVGRAGGRGRP